MAQCGCGEGAKQPRSQARRWGERARRIIRKAARPCAGPTPFTVSRGAMSAFRTFYCYCSRRDETTSGGSDCRASEQERKKEE